MSDKNSNVPDQDELLLKEIRTSINRAGVEIHKSINHLGIAIIVILCLALFLQYGPKLCGECGGKGNVATATRDLRENAQSGQEKQCPRCSGNGYFLFNPKALFWYPSM